MLSSLISLKKINGFPLLQWVFIAYYIKENPLNTGNKGLPVLVLTYTFGCLSIPAGPLSIQPHGLCSPWPQGFCTCYSPCPEYCFPPFYFKEIFSDLHDIITYLYMLEFTFVILPSFQSWLCESGDWVQCIFGNFHFIGTPCASVASPIKQE